jgi:hypothetical protein
LWNVKTPPLPSPKGREMGGMGFEYRFLIKVNYSASIFMHNNCNFAAI